MNPSEVRSLSVEAWYALSREGISLPVTIRLQGSSMEPLIRRDRDPVRILPLEKTPTPGDVVLLRRPDGVCVLHRLYWIDPEGERVQTWGDNCVCPDPPVPLNALLGYAVSVEKNGRQLRLDTEKQRKRGLAWLRSPICRPVWQFGRRLLHRITRHTRK